MGFLASEANVGPHLLDPENSGARPSTSRDSLSRRTRSRTFGASPAHLPSAPAARCRFARRCLEEAQRRDHRTRSHKTGECRTLAADFGPIRLGARSAKAAFSDTVYSHMGFDREVVRDGPMLAGRYAL